MNSERYNPDVENSRVEFEASQNIRKLFGVGNTEEISELSKTGIKNAKNRVFNIAESIGIPEAIIDLEDSYRHSLVLPSGDFSAGRSLHIQRVGMHKDELYKVKPSLLFLNQIYKGLEIAHGQVAFFESDEDYSRLKTETIGFVFRYGIAHRLIQSMQEKMPGDKSIFRKQDIFKGFNSFAGFMAIKHLMVDAIGVLTPEGIYDIQDEFPASVRAATNVLISRKDAAQKLLIDNATFGITRPMEQTEVSDTLDIYYNNSRPYLVAV